MSKQKIIAVSGLKNSGKTTLIEKLIPALARRGIKTAVIKHDGHSFLPDRENTDTHRALSAGAYGAAVFDGEKFQLVKYAPADENSLIPLFPEADLILLEGFKYSSYPKIEVIRPGACPVCDPSTVAAYIGDMVTSDGIPCFGFDDIENLAEFILEL